MVSRGIIFAIGHLSIIQFSREYSRLSSQTPRDIKTLKGSRLTLMNIVASPEQSLAPCVYQFSYISLQKERVESFEN